MDEVPEEVLFYIFMFLTGEEVESAKEVCTFWKEIAAKDHLWKSVFLNKYKINTRIATDNWKALYYEVNSQISDLLVAHERDNARLKEMLHTQHEQQRERLQLKIDEKKKRLELKRRQQEEESQGENFNNVEGNSET
eukprot:CAMPEP_0114988714 /NCGR_PEP_ID=MMETSP0216-20121206/9763_1 /TAXON_ID=223996 /ORGANISM="Protocruzia adherens, Strain Boccale" /LENGTH=136 /DNA_ID=CAMNT_0002351547 /DNA_START=209 /DNA_END=619 /DNA_ORIENTATION=-